MRDSRITVPTTDHTSTKKNGRGGGAERGGVERTKKSAAVAHINERHSTHINVGARGWRLVIESGVRIRACQTLRRSSSRADLPFVGVRWRSPRSGGCCTALQPQPLPPRPSPLRHGSVTMTVQRMMTARRSRELRRCTLTSPSVTSRRRRATVRRFAGTRTLGVVVRRRRPRRLLASEEEEPYDSHRLRLQSFRRPRR